MAPGNALIPQLTGAYSGISVRRHTFDLAARTESVALARRRSRDLLTGWGHHEELHETAELVISELVTNAVVHTAGDYILCELTDHQSLLRIAVRDLGCGTAGPRLCHSADEEERGRGLLLVDAVSSSWGTHDAPYGPGRIVWAELAHDGPRQAGRPC
ncbi:ATP-binding protein [Streptomyces sp. NPDC051993]|uniref:ATP-binding protein n=1 Tax=Streptomyces sp. NPDC051993 TaxID=3155286 RepID=UPI00343B8DA9